MLTLENKLNFAKEGKLENKPKKKKKSQHLQCGIQSDLSSCLKTGLNQFKSIVRPII